ncbi:transcription factor bHLH118-like, partial [Rhodamnia argentea]|uniref:Transcription factor bHLH118-like n=1 Tax=Rhodamnia argentea TaxID=178133 RepID=A0ABM3GYM1_9MYRT
LIKCSYFHSHSSSKLRAPPLIYTFLSKTFPLQPNTDLLYLPLNHYPIPEDRIIHDDEDLHGLCVMDKKDKNKGLGKSALISCSGSSKRDEDCDPQKKMHRDVERGRRREMSTLCASLRSLLPLEYIKGNRTTSDHIGGAANYINHLERKIKELESRRDELKSSNRSVRASSVGPCLDGVEIVIQSASSRDQDPNFPLSKALQLLLEEGISVASCVSTRISEMTFIHTIQSEVQLS